MIALRVVGAILGAAIALWGLAPIVAGRFHVGCVALVVIGAALFLFCVFSTTVVPWITCAWQQLPWRVVLITAGAAAAALAVLFITISGLMIGASATRPKEDATLIVLGAGLRGDQPSKILRGRLDATVAYLNEHTQAVCVVTGGQGHDEPCTEAEVMRRYLVEKGIAEQRIYVEGKATSTYENIWFSKEIIQKHALSENVAVVTQEFHQYRAQQFAKAAFAHVGGVTAHSPFYLLGSYWVRDVAGVCHMVLFGK